MPVCLYSITPSQQQQETRSLAQREEEHISSSSSLINTDSDEETEGIALNEIYAAQQAELGSMPCWYYEKKELRNTPSVRDGISIETERRYRKEGARFIMSCGTQMGIGHNTMATGIVYFHRFYMFHSFRTFPRYVTACCCLLLAGKVEETPKKCRDVIQTARTLLDDNYFYSFGEDPKEEVMTLERVLIQTIKFDLQVDHPHTFLLKYAKCVKGDQQKLQKMVQMAWNFVNDSLSTTVCLQWEPEIIAVALIHLASKLSKFVINDWSGREPNHVRWWDMFVQDVTMEMLEDICHQVLDLYQNSQKDESNGGGNSPPQKPPSRADSPTPLIKQLSPLLQQQQQQQPPPPPSTHHLMDMATYHHHPPQQPHYETNARGNNKFLPPPPPPPPPNDVQAIKSLANSGHNRQQPMASYYHTDMYDDPPLPSQSVQTPMHYAEPPPPPPPPPSHATIAGSYSRSIPMPPLPPMPPPADSAYYGRMPAPMPPAAASSNLKRVSLLPPPPPPPFPNGGANRNRDNYYQRTQQSSHRSRHHQHRSRRY